MDILALRGFPNQGKTETLNIVYQLLLQEGFIQTDPSHFSILGNPIQKDFRDILERNGKKVGIVTMGDYYSGNNSVGILLKYLSDQNCDIAVCACNTNIQGTIDAVMEYENNQIIAKTTTLVHGSQRILNGQDANLILSLI